MKVINIHSRTIHQPKVKVVELLRTLATQNDKVWPKGKWPPMKFKQEIKVGAIGGHGPIHYRVEKYDPHRLIEFNFLKPHGFNGIHKFEIQTLNSESTEVKHSIEMNTTGKGSLLWLLGIRSLHNALIEDAFDNLENYFSEYKKTTAWNPWVLLLRKLFS